MAFLCSAVRVSSLSINSSFCSKMSMESRDATRESITASLAFTLSRAAARESLARLSESAVAKESRRAASRESRRTLSSESSLICSKALRRASATAFNESRTKISLLMPSIYPGKNSSVYRNSGCFTFSSAALWHGLSSLSVMT